MKILFICIALFFLSACIQGGYHPTYIISEQCTQEAAPSVEEEAR